MAEFRIVIYNGLGFFLLMTDGLTHLSPPPPRFLAGYAGQTP